MALLLVAFGQIYQSINVQGVLDLLFIFLLLLLFFFMVGAHMFLFSSFFVCFCFFRKQFWANFLCFLFIYFHFIKVPIYTQFFFKVYNVLLFVLSNRDMIVNLYKLYFQSFHF